MNKRKRTNTSSSKTKRTKKSTYNSRRKQLNSNDLAAELKFLDTAVTGLTFANASNWTAGELQPSSGCTDCLNAPAQGDSSSERDGKQIAMKSIILHGQITVPTQTNQGGQDSTGTIFLALVMDTQCNGVALNSEDVYTNPSGSSNGSVVPLRNMIGSQRYQVLKTKTIVLPQVDTCFDGTNIEQQGYTIPFTMAVNLKNTKVNFSTAVTTAVVGAIVDNSITLIAQIDKNGLAPVLTYNCRLRFVG